MPSLAHSISLGCCQYRHWPMITLYCDYADKPPTPTILLILYQLHWVKSLILTANSAMVVIARMIKIPTIYLSLAVDVTVWSHQ